MKFLSTVFTCAVVGLCLFAVSSVSAGETVAGQEPACFRGDTLIATEHGERPIRDVEVGDRVWSWDMAAGREVLRRVARTHRRPGVGLRALGVDESVIYTTDEHPYWVEGVGWKRAADLAAGDKLRSRGDRILSLTSNHRVSALVFYGGYARDQNVAIEGASDPMFRTIAFGSGMAFRERGRPDSADIPMVYNIEVEDTHTFFAGSERVLVHNK
jgi:hypothetical protein